MNLRRIPADFPRASSQGSVPGAQPKLLVNRTGDTYSAARAEADVYGRYLGCDDLAQQLAAYVSRKMASTLLSPDKLASNVEAGFRKKVQSGLWDFSEEEIAWTIKRMRQLYSVVAVEKHLEPDAIENRERPDGE